MNPFEQHSTVSQNTSRYVRSSSVGSERNFLLLPRRPLLCTATQIGTSVTPRNSTKDNESTPRSLYKSRKRRVRSHDLTETSVVTTPERSSMIHAQRVTSDKRLQQKQNKLLFEPDLSLRKEQMSSKANKESSPYLDQSVLDDDNQKENTPVRCFIRKVSVGTPVCSKLPAVSFNKEGSDLDSPLTPKKYPLMHLSPVRTPERQPMVPRKAFVPLTPSQQQNSWRSLSPPPANRLHYATPVRQACRSSDETNDESSLVQNIVHLSIGADNRYIKCASQKTKSLPSSKRTHSKTRHNILPSLNPRYDRNIEFLPLNPQEREVLRTDDAHAETQSEGDPMPIVPCEILSTSFRSDDYNSPDACQNRSVSGYESSQSSLSESNDELEDQEEKDIDFFLLDPSSSSSLMLPPASGKKQRKQDTP